MYRKGNYYYTFGFLNKFMKHSSCTVCFKFEVNKLKGFRSFQTSVLFSNSNIVIPRLTSDPANEFFG